MTWTVIAEPIKQLSDYIRSNWPTAPFVPAQDKIAWNSWQSPLANTSFMIEEIGTDPQPETLGWGLRSYRGTYRIHMWTAFLGSILTEVIPPILKNSREHLDKFLSQNHRGLAGTGIHSLRPYPPIMYRHDPDPNADKWQLIFPVQMIYYKNI